MTDWNKLFSLSSTDTESGLEEHNRYIRPPKGVSVNKWFINLFKLKYDYAKHIKDKTNDD